VDAHEARGVQLLLQRGEGLVLEKRPPLRPEAHVVVLGLDVIQVSGREHVHLGAVTDEDALEWPRRRAGRAHQGGDGRPLAVREPEPDTGEAAGLPAAVEGLERRMIREALARADGIQTRAAELLGISERVLRYKLRKYGLSGG